MSTRTVFLPRLVELPVAAKLTITAFVLLVAAGYLVASVKVYVWHSEADGVAGLSPDDLRAVFHGLDKRVTKEVRSTLKSEMLREVLPGGGMHNYLAKGGPPAIKCLTGWLEAGASQAEFIRPAIYEPNGPSASQVIAERCVSCHRKGGDNEDLVYADPVGAGPRYELVAKVATPPVAPATTEVQSIHIEPTSSRELLHVTHAHILAIPVFTLVMAAFFLMTGLHAWIKTVLAPLPLIATMVDVGCWWLARSFEPAIHGIALAGAVFGLAFGLQIISVLGSTWFGRRTPAAATILADGRGNS